MDKPENNLNFSIISFCFKIRDMIRSPHQTLREVDIKPGDHVLDYGCGPGEIGTREIEPRLLREIQDLPAPGIWRSQAMGFFKNIFNRQPKPGKPRPVTDETFEQEVLKSDIPSVVDFWASWCAPCHVMGGLLDEIGPDYIGRVNMFKLNIDQNRKTAAKYGVRSIPTVILFRNGKPVDAIIGLLPLNPLRQKLDRLAR